MLVARVWGLGDPHGHQVARVRSGRSTWRVQRRPPRGGWFPGTVEHVGEAEAHLLAAGSNCAEGDRDTLGARRREDSRMAPRPRGAGVREWELGPHESTGEWV